MNIINMLKNVAFMVDPGPDENSALWKMLDAYYEADSNSQPKENICTIESVLEASDVLSFIQHNHQPLINFLTEKDNLHKLLNYITSCPDDNTLLSQQSCKILCHNFASVREAVFVDASDNLDILFGFENEDQLISETLKNIDAMHSGLLTQVVQKFLNTHNWYMVDYFSSKEAFKVNPNQLLYSSGLLQTLVDTNYCYSGSSLGQWMESINIVQILVDTFKGNSGEACISSASDVLQNIIQSVSPLLVQLESSPIILLSQLLEDSFNSDNPFCNTATTEVITVCTCLSQKYENESPKSIPESLVPIVNHIENFNSILAPTENSEILVNTSGNVIPFGMKRMKVVELYRALMNIQCDEINQILLEKTVFQYLLDSFFLYKWNNILQTSVMGMFNLVFTSGQNEFCKKVLEQTNLIPRVSKLLLEDLQKERNGEPVSAYRGFFRTLESTFHNLRIIGDLSSVFDSCTDWNKLVTFTSNTGIDEEAGINTKSNVFGGLSFTLDIEDNDLSSSLKTNIENNGGTVIDSIDNDCFALVSVPSLVENISILSKQAKESNVPIINQNFINESISQKSLCNTEDFVIQITVSSSVVEKNIEPIVEEKVEEETKEEVKEEEKDTETNIVVNTEENTDKNTVSEEAEIKIENESESTSNEETTSNKEITSNEDEKMDEDTNDKVESMKEDNNEEKKQTDLTSNE